MAKNKTLPTNFQEIVNRGNLEELKVVFKKCNINAYVRYGSDTALSFQGLTKEMILWLIEQGADINFAKSRTSRTPLCNQVTYQCNAESIEFLAKHGVTDVHPTKDNSEIIEFFIELGAEIEPNNFQQPLDHACFYLNPKAVKILLKHGVNPNGNGGSPPLTKALNNLALIPKTLEIAEIFLDAGVKIDSYMQELITVMGKDYQADKESYPKINNSEEVLHKLYELFDVEPVEPIVKHDGTSDICINEENLQEAFEILWDLLVPANGKAKTIQGEIIRITGRVTSEISRNGGRNWDDEFKKMLDYFIQVLQTGNQLSENDIAKVQFLVKQVYYGNQRKYDEAVELSNYAVVWIKHNKQPIKLPKVDYSR